MTKWEPVPIHERWASDEEAGFIPKAYPHDEFEIRHNLSFYCVPEDEIEAIVHFAKQNDTMKQVHEWLKANDWDWPKNDMGYFERLNDVIEGRG